MPYLNEHSCRLINPDEFIRFIRKQVKDDNDVGDYKATGKSYDLIIGYRKDDSTDVQAHRYKKDEWTIEQARKHCSAYKGISFEPAQGSEDNIGSCCGAAEFEEKIETQNITESQTPHRNRRGIMKAQPRHNSIRCFEGNAKPHEAFWRMRNATDTGGEPEMELYGYISEYSWLDDDITPKQFKADLYTLGRGGPITVRINSGGGDVIAASMIRSIISDYPGPITVRIDGLAASAAVIVAMAGQTVRIMDTAYMMIHDPAVAFFLAVLDIETLGRLYDSLKSVKAGIVDVYADKTGISTDRIGRMMAAETWMSAQEAIDYGFADEIITGGQKPTQPTNAVFINALTNYKNVPAALMNIIGDRDVPQSAENQRPTEGGSSPVGSAAKFRAEIKLLCKNGGTK